MSLRSIPTMLMRGGSSKGYFFERSHLPMDDQDKLDEILLTLFGSPDPYQIDGIGGGGPKSSKAFIVSQSEQTDVDLTYTVGQVGIDEKVVDWRGNSGNVTHAVGCFALERGLVHPEGGKNVILTLENTNTGVIINQEIQLCENHNPKYKGDFHVPGVPNPSAPIHSNFLDPGGAITEALFPTGSPIESLEVPGVGSIRASIVDVTNPVVFVEAAELGLQGNELPKKINEFKDQLSAIRNQAAVEIGFANSFETAAKEAYNTPMLVIVGERSRYELIDGNWISADEYDLLGRYFNQGRVSSAFAMTSAMCTAAASVLDGTIVNQYVPSDVTNVVRLGTPSGVVEVRVDGDSSQINSVGVTRSARKLIEGNAYYEI